MTRFSSGSTQNRFAFLLEVFTIHRVFRNFFFKEHTRDKAAKYFSNILSEMT